MNKKRLAGYVVMFGLFIGLVLGWTQRASLYDYYRLYNYTPPEAIVTLANNTGMNDKMRRIYYANHPGLEDKTTFNAHCRENEQTIVLGCFIERQGIYVLKVDDARLSGVQEVTAAHETLHAVYARLSSSDRKKIDALVSDTFSKMNDPELQSTIELYKKKDPSVVPNELHSILGTEYRDLPPELEAHYTKYFSERQKVVGFAEQYKQVFIDERNQVKDYDAQLAGLKAQISTLESALTGQDKALDAKRTSLNSLRSQGKYDQYNAAVPVYNTMVNNYNSSVDKLRDLIEKYNQIVPIRNAVTNEQQELVNAIDSRELQAAPKQ